MSRPGNVLFYAMVLTVSGVWCLVWGLGNSGAEAESAWIGWGALLFGAFSLYAGPALFLGEDAARNVAQWLAGIQLTWVQLVAACAILGVVNPSYEGVTLDAAGIAGLSVRFFLSMMMLWHLSGPEALAFTTGGHGHDSHGHEGSAHA